MEMEELISGEFSSSFVPEPPSSSSDKELIVNINEGKDSSTCESCSSISDSEDSETWDAYLFSESESDSESDNTNNNKITEIGNPLQICNSNKSNIQEIDVDKIRKALSNWAVVTGERGNKLRLLLLELKNAGIDGLPSTPDSLLHINRRAVDLESFSNGEFFYFGVRKMIMYEINSVQDCIIQDLVLTVNVDGIPLFKSDTTEFWCILGKCNVPHTSVFPIGIWCGRGKPDVKPFLSKFVEEINQLTSETFCMIGMQPIKLNMGPILADAPAKAFLKCVVQYSGYYGCDYCVQKGEYVKSVVFPLVKSTLRTDSSFRHRHYPEHHKAERSPLENVPGLDMIYSFPHDPLHQLYLGVMRRNLYMWCVQRKGKFRLRPPLIKKMSERMQSYAKFAPLEFNRKPRAIQFLKQFKGQEYKHILIYYCFHLLKNVTSDDQYQHFLHMHVACYIFSCPELISKFGNQANYFLYKFVVEGMAIYGREYAVYNVHNLVHLWDDVNKWGTINDFSAFVFESFLGKLKRMLKKPNQPLMQVVISLLAKMDNTDKLAQSRERKEALLNPIVTDPGKFSRLETNIFTIDCLKDGNNIVLLSDGCVMSVEYFRRQDGTILLGGYCFAVLESAFKYPIDSKQLGIYKATELELDIRESTISEISAKMCVIPDEEDKDNTRDNDHILHLVPLCSTR